jgi:hypothetical protein
LSWDVTTREDIVLEDGIYEAVVSELKKVDTQFGERVLWLFHPNGYDEDVRVPGFTSLSPSNKAKAAKWSRIILNIPKDQTTVNWGPNILEGKPCRIYVEVSEDADGFERNIVSKLLPASKATKKRPKAKPAVQEISEEEVDETMPDFSDLDMGDQQKAS